MLKHSLELEDYEWSLRRLQLSDSELKEKIVAKVIELKTRKEGWYVVDTNGKFEKL